jgi:hypothetical protein
MEQVTTIGLDIAKSVFQVHGVGADGPVVIRRQLRRAQVSPFFERPALCLIDYSADDRPVIYTGFAVGTWKIRFVKLKLSFGQPIAIRHGQVLLPA